MGTISIAMTTYCGEKFIEKQLTSLLNQRRQADEVLIFDDRSKDRTAEIVTSFIQKNELNNWHFKVNDENLGFIKNFRQAIENSTGDIVFLCDQDDIWHDDKLEKVEKLFDEHPDAFAINASFCFIDGEDKPIDVPEKPGTSNHNLIFQPVEKGDFVKIEPLEIVKGNISPGCTMAFRSTVREFYKAHTKASFPHDYEINIIASNLGNVYFYNDELISYRIHSSNTIGLETKKQIKTKLNANQEKRLKILDGQQAVCDYLENDCPFHSEEINKYVEHYKAYLKLRYDCIVERKLSSWFGMQKHFNYLTPQTPKKQLVGDLLYALRVEKLFERS